MNAIIKQSRANLRKRKLQSVLTLITLTAAAALLTIALCTLNTAQGAYDRLFERINGAHLWLSLNLNLDAIEETEQLLADLTGVESTTGLMPIVYSDIFVGEKRLRNEELRPWPDDVTAPASPLIVEGNAPLAGETDTIVLDRNMAVLEGVAVGDTIRLLTPDGLVPLTVVGLSINAETCPYGNCFPVPHYLAPDALAALNLYNPSGRVLVTIGMRLIEPTKWESVLQAAKNALPANVLRGWKEWSGIRSGADASIESMRILLLIFCTVAVLSAGFLIANAITGAVMAQTRQIGLLKAIGFTRFQLGLTYLAEYVGFGLLASLLGLAAGVPASMLILRELAGKFGEEMLLPPVWVFLVVPLSILALTTIFTMLPVQRAVRLDAVTAIRIGQQGSRRRGISLPRLALPLAIGIKDTLSHPLRFALTALGLGMAIFAMTVALALNAIVEGFSTDPKYGARPDGDLFLWRTIQYSDDEVQRLITDQPEVVASYGLVWYGFQFPGNERVYFGRFFAGDLQDFEFGLAEGRMLQNADEAVVGYAIAAQRNLHVGDSLDILIDETPATVTVTGIYHELNNEGRMIIFSLDLLQRINPKVTLTSYTLRLSPSADEESIISALTSASNYQLDIRSARETGVDNSTMAMLEMVTWLTIILTAIASLGIFNSVWMGIQERRREMALLKAIGMTPGQVVLSVLVGTGVIALCSYIVGLPVGSLCTYALTDMVGRSMGYGPLPFILKIPDLVLILPVILLIAVAGALIPARRAARTNTVAVLQYE